MASRRMVSGSSRMQAILSWVLGGCYWRATSEWEIVRQLVQASTRCLPIPVLALTAQTPHWASVMARKWGTGPARCSKRRGAWLLPDPWPVPPETDEIRMVAGSADRCHAPSGLPSALRAPGKPEGAYHRRNRITGSCC